MTKLFVFLLVVLLAFFAYQYYFGKPKQIVITKEVPVYTKERYGTELRKIHDAVFADLDTLSPNPTAELQKLWGSVEHSIQAGSVNPRIGYAALRLCTLLSNANLEREARELRLKEIRIKDYVSFTKQRALQKKQFFESAEHRKWKDYVTRTRPACKRILKQLRVSELDH